MNKNYGIEGQQAPELAKFKWLDANGKEIVAFQLSDYSGKFVVFYCFQSWCPGCHKIGFPSLQKMVATLKESEAVKFFAIQTVFEGKSQNTFEKLIETQKQYQLEIPFGQDEGDEKTNNISSTMYHYRTGGTPWFIFIDQKGTVVFNDFHLNTEEAIKFLKTIK
ncbi:peroxiredoxin family protein [Muriicola sp.]|uniref:peroxiredoxin family protein n=1 Tax=Muriicola sp. TaxID=2020856 RepID=UPI003C77E1DB